MVKVSISVLEKRLKALADPTRMKMVAMLSVRPLCVCELTSALSLAQPTISRHLRILEEAGFVTKERQGNWVIYSLQPVDTICADLLDMVLPHLAEDPQCRSLIKAIQGMDRRSLSEDRGCGWIVPDQCGPV